MSTKVVALLERYKQRRDLNEEIKNLEKEICAEISPYKIGDVVESFGTHFRKTCRIEEIAIVIRHEGRFDLSVCARVLRKDGADSKFWASWSSRQDSKLKEALQKLTQL